MLNAIHIYRIGRFLHLKKIPILPKIFEKITFFMYNSVVPPTASIGEGTLLGYGGIGVLIHPKAVIGCNVKIGSNVTIGGKSGKPNVPVIGDNVFIASGAKILGDLLIGNNAVVGANAVVLKDVPENAVVGGIPAKILKYRTDTSKRYG